MKTEKRMELIKGAWSDVKLGMTYLDTYKNPYKAYVCLDKALGPLRQLHAEFEEVLEAQNAQNAQNAQKELKEKGVKQW